MHWDDDDVHHPDRVSMQALPILTRQADVTVLSQSYVAVLSERPLSFLKDAKPGPFLGSLAYERSIVVAHGGFRAVSLGEDLELTDRLLQHCHELQMVNLPSVYVRHGHNTWQWSAQSMPKGQFSTVPPPMWVTDMRWVEALEQAVADMDRRPACPVPELHLPSDFKVETCS